MTDPNKAPTEIEAVRAVVEAALALGTSMDEDFGLWSSPSFSAPRRAAWATYKASERAQAALSRLEAHLSAPVVSVEDVEILVGKHLGPHLGIAPTPRHEAIVRNFARTIDAMYKGGR